jgi:hypothetical protein
MAIFRGTVSVLAAKQATSLIPIVFAEGDPVGTGFVVSLGRPGGNVTGRSFRQTDLAAKRLELFCARLSLLFAGQRFWPRPAILLPCGTCVRLRQRPARSASRW